MAFEKTFHQMSQPIEVVATNPPDDEIALISFTLGAERQPPKEVILTHNNLGNGVKQLDTGRSPWRAILSF